jgi:hypothetical protein
MICENSRDYSYFPLEVAEPTAFASLSMAAVPLNVFREREQLYFRCSLFLSRLVHKQYVPTVSPAHMVTPIDQCNGASQMSELPRLVQQFEVKIAMRLCSRNLLLVYFFVNRDIFAEA